MPTELNFGGLEFRLLGPLEITLAGRPLNITAPRLQGALGALLLHADKVVTAEYLVESIWEGDPPSNPSNQVAVCISMLRRKLRGSGVMHEIVTTHPSGYRFNTKDVKLDTATVLELRSAAQRHIAEGQPEEALPVLREALSLWRGQAMSGYSRELWYPEIQRWEEEYFSVRNLCSEVQLKLGHYQDLVSELSVFIQKYPLLEHPRGVLMVALARSGRQAEALQLYHETASRLREELGVLPGPDLQRLHEQLLQGGLPSPPVSVHGAGTSGSHQDAVPPPDQEAAPQQASAVAVPCQLPGDLANFVGREKEVVALRDAVAPAAGPVPLVLLVGPGGTGKTALAVHAAHRMRSVFTDGQLYINLRGMSKSPVMPAEALGRFLRELGMTGRLPETLDERAEAYRSLLADRRMLIVLDDAADAQQVTPLLPGTASSAVLVTSRTRLTTLPTTRVLEIGVFRKQQALDLLSVLVGDRRISAEQEAARELVDFCGRLPLAVHILGAKLVSKPHWTLRKAAARLTDERRRLDELSHDNLEVRASIELSHQGISPAARQLFRRLALVAASSDFAEWVCAPLTELPLDQTEDLLEELLDARLVDVVSPERAGEPRYRMHDLVRLYALEQAHALEPAEQRSAALARLGMTALALADRAHRAVCGGDYTVVHHLTQSPTVLRDVLDRVGADPLAWYDADRFTISVLCQQLAEQGQDELAWDLASTARCQFALHFHFDEWEATHEAALRASRLRGNERGAAAMLLGLGDLYLTKRDYARAVPLLEESHTLFQKVGDPYGYALALRKAAAADRVQGRLERALSRWQKCLPILREAGDIEAQAQVLRWSGQTLLEAGRAEEGGSLLREARQVVDGFQGRSLVQVRLSLGEHCLVLGEIDEASTEFARGLSAARRSGDLSAQCFALWGLGWVGILRGHLAEGEERLSQAQDLARRIHDPLLESDVLFGLAASHYLSGDQERALSRLEHAAGLCRRMNAPTRLQRILKAHDDASAGIEPALFIQRYSAR